MTHGSEASEIAEMGIAGDQSHTSHLRPVPIHAVQCKVFACHWIESYEALARDGKGKTENRQWHTIWSMNIHNVIL